MKKMLDVYRFCPTCRANLENSGLHKFCKNCRTHVYISPTPAVAVVMENESGELLLIKRALNPFKNWWDMPGGFVERGESLEEGAAREIKEETGLTVDKDSLVYLDSYVADYEFEEIDYELIVVMFKIDIPSSANVVVADDANAFKFVKKSEINIDEIAFKQQREFLKKYLKLG